MLVKERSWTGAMSSRKGTGRAVAAILAFGILMPSGMATAAPNETVPAANGTSAASDVVKFADANFKKCVTDSLGLEPDAVVTKSMLRDLAEVVCIGQDIVDISPIRYASNLASIFVDENNIEDISALAGLTGLSELGLAGNKISDISALAGLKGLGFLDFGRNAVSDVTSLKGLKDLTVLSFADNQVQDLTPLANLSGLWFLSLERNRVTDLTPLNELQEIYEVGVSDQTIVLDDVESGDPASLPQVRAFDGTPIALTITSGNGIVDGNSVTWDMTEGGEASLEWSQFVAAKSMSSGVTFSGTVTQSVLPVAEIPVLGSAVPTIGGSALAGQVLTAKPGTWTSGTAFTYQWNVDGVPVAGATESSFALTTAHLGKSVSVTVTGTKDGFASVSEVSLATSKVKGKPGWLNEAGTWYHFGKDGALQTGWVAAGGTWYYLDASGVMQTGWLSLGGKWYYLDASGAMQTGWEQVGGSWYYLDASGVMQTGWKSLGGKWYYLQSGGAMATGWAKVGGAWYYLNSGGDMRTGWLKQGSSWYYLKASGEMVTGKYTIAGKVNTFDANGVWRG
ncbi:MAG: hypothetical protein QM705_13780 [Ancrocorticia sp.]